MGFFNLIQSHQKIKPTFDKEELHSLEKTFKLFADRNGYMNLNNMIIATKELKFDESEPVVYDLIVELESENKSSITYDDFIDKLTAKSKTEKVKNLLKGFMNSSLKILIIKYLYL